MRSFLSSVKKIIPAPLFKALAGPYHFSLAFFAALIYGFPSKKMIVVGVTGTKGKTTTANLIEQILTQAGYKTGLTTTTNFKIAGREWENQTKQTMLGRFALQKLLRQIVEAGCTHAVVEVSSEGILQYRQRFIDFDAAVFTNLTPEHLERHGGFENYRAAKVKLFEKVARQKEGIGVYNLDDRNAEYFLKPPVKNKYGFGLHPRIELPNQFQIANIKLTPQKTGFEINGEKFEMPLLGEFNVTNAAAAITTALALGIEMQKIKTALRGVKAPAGRFERIPNSRGITIIVDYSYETSSFEKALQAMRLFNPPRVIVIIGGTGGGRDKWRRPILGEIADKYADIAIITTDDPYDEDPGTIADEILEGAKRRGDRVLGENLFRILDRREAIKKALALARRGDALLVSGMGAERSITVASGKTIPWNDREVIEEELKNL